MEVVLYKKWHATIMVYSCGKGFVLQGSKQTIKVVLL